MASRHPLICGAQAQLYWRNKSHWRVLKCPITFCLLHAEDLSVCLSLSLHKTSMSLLVTEGKWQGYQRVLLLSGNLHPKELWRAPFCGIKAMDSPTGSGQESRAHLVQHPVSHSGLPDALRSTQDNEILPLTCICHSAPGTDQTTWV